MSKPDYSKITGVPMYYLPLVPGQHQFAGFDSIVTDRHFLPDGSYTKRRPKEPPAYGFDKDCKPLWPSCAHRVQGVYHVENDALQMVCQCKNKQVEASGKLTLDVEDCIGCPFKEKPKCTDN